MIILLALKEEYQHKKDVELFLHIDTNNDAKFVFFLIKKQILNVLELIYQNLKHLQNQKVKFWRKILR